MQLIARREVDTADFVDDIAEQITALHTIIDALEDGRDDIAPVVTVRAGELAQICEQALPALSVGAPAFILIDERKQFVAGHPLRVGGPIAPPVRWLYRRPEFLSGQLSGVLPLQFQIIKKFQEHDPGEQRQPVEIAIEALILAHDIACRLDHTPEGLGCRQFGAGAATRASLGGIEMSLQFRHGIAQLIGAAEETDDFTNLTMV